MSLNRKIYNDLRNTDYYALESKLDKIKAPILIAWGDSDKAIHISAVEIYKKNIKNA